MAKTIRGRLNQNRKKYQDLLEKRDEDLLKKEEVKKIEKKEKIKRDFSEDYEQKLKNELVKLAKEDIVFSEKENIYTQVSNPMLENANSDWDVTKDSPILYFDSDLSYELTKYRPITENLGLDFDPEPFCEIANIYKRTGNFTEFKQGGKPYADFWTEQLDRCRYGYTYGNYTITGDHYYFLNFYRMSIVASDSAGEGREDSFPAFHAKQYEFFHYIALCEAAKKDAILLKARGLGFSEMMAALGIRPYLTNRKFRVVYTCPADNKLEPLLSKCWWQMNWLNQNSGGGLKRLRQKVDNSMHKRASQVTKDGVEFGRMSEIKGIVADSSDKIRGDRVDRLFKY